jgi:hypothetical protein
VRRLSIVYVLIFIPSIHQAGALEVGDAEDVPPVAPLDPPPKNQAVAAEEEPPPLQVSRSSSSDKLRF